MSADATDASRSLKHIDIAAIVSRHEARLRFIKDFVGFGKDDQQALSESLLLLGPRLPAILDQLYDHMLSYDDTRRIFLGASGELDPNYIVQRKEHLTEWVLMAAASPAPDAFAAFAVKVARQHTGVDGNKNRAVPPRYIVAVTARIQTAFLQAVFAAIPDDPAAALRIGLAWNKFLIVQLELFLHEVAPHWPFWDEVPPRTSSVAFAGLRSSTAGGM